MTIGKKLDQGIEAVGDAIQHGKQAIKDGIGDFKDAITPKPSPGRIVHVRLVSGTIVPAVIAAVNEDGTIDAVIFQATLATGTKVMRGIPPQPSAGPDTDSQAVSWHWPPRV